jgi:hypothetical protein
MEPKKLDEEAVPSTVEDNEKINTDSLSSPDSEGETLTYEDDRVRRESEFLDAIGRNAAAKLRNPLAGLNKTQLMVEVEEFAKEKDLVHALEDLKKGALVAQNPTGFESIEELTEDDKEILRRETTHRWSQPWMMYFMTSRFTYILFDCSPATN